MIQFEEGQEVIYAGGKKITPSRYDGHIDLHVRCDADEQSGYDGKFVCIIAVENIYDFDTIKEIKVNSLDEIQSIKFFENGGYEYDRKTF